jgi:hypothetical protein
MSTPARRFPPPWRVDDAGDGEGLSKGCQGFLMGGRGPLGKLSLAAVVALDGTRSSSHAPPFRPSRQ